MSKANPLIAVVDDEPPVRTMLRRALQLADYEVATFSGGEEFLAALPTLQPACVILDIRMPSLSGFEVERRMREMSLRPPVILITASDDATIDRSAAAAGVVCLLRKPFSTEALLAAVREALGKELLGT